MTITLQKYNKYGNIKTTVDETTFSSKKEANRYSELKLLERAGEIKGLRIQEPFLLQEAFIDRFGIKHRAIAYVADFTYCETRKPDVTVVEDTKGWRTKEYKLKKKLLLYKYKHIDFREI